MRRRGADTGRRGGGRLHARPRTPETAPYPPGLHPLRLTAHRDTLLYVPERPITRLVVMFHGAGSEALRGLGPFHSLADPAGLLLLAPTSRAGTWDVLLGGFGDDVRLLEQALEQVFSAYAVDRVAMAGFSDGASYALSLGLTNGDLVDTV